MVVESPVANSVTSWPRATSPSVSSEVIVWTEPDLGGGMLVATGATWAILSGCMCRAASAAADLRVEVLGGNLARAPGVRG